MMPTTRRLGSSAALFCVCSCLVAAIAQQAPPDPSPQPPQQPTFRSGVNLVRVDVAVTDRRGMPVADLTERDFEVFEDGAPQSIESFRLVKLDGEQAPDENLSLPIRSDEHATAEAARDEVRLFALFLDDYHVSPMRGTLVVREALTRFVRENLGPTDLIAVMDPLTPLSSLKFTRDRFQLLERVRTFKGRRGQFYPPRSVIEEQQLQSRNPSRVRVEVTISALEALVTRLGSLREGRKSVILVSEGFPLGFRSQDVTSRFQDLLRAANRGNTAIYSLDPTGLGGRRNAGADVLQTLSAETGGRAIVNVNDLSQGLAQVVRDASAYYLLGYASQASLDGRYHKIQVRVKRSGLEVQARRGYWAPGDADLERAAAAAADKPPGDIAEALAVFAKPRTGWPVHTWTGVARGEEGRPRVVFAWEPRAAPGEPAPRGLRVTLKASTGDVVFYEGEVPARDASGPSHVAFDAQPGALKLTVAVDRGDGAPPDEERHQLEIGDPASVPVWLSTPRIYRVRNIVEQRAFAAGSDPAPVAVREFDREDRLFIRIEAHAHDAAVPPVSAQLLSRQGRKLLDLPVTPPTPARRAHQIDLPLGSIGSSTYVIRIEASAGEAKAVQHVAINVR
jgi:VWFA-related protein